MNASLWIDDDPVPRGFGAIDFVLAHPTIQTSAHHWIAQAGEPPQPGLYVFEREWAAVPRTRRIRLGSDRATTCHILIALSERTVFAAHLNGVSGQIQELIEALHEVFGPEGSQTIDLHIAGGFADERGISRRLGRRLFFYLASDLQLRYQLKTACVGPLNTAAELSAPIVRALSVEAIDGVVKPNIWFDDLGPQSEWRAAFASHGTLPLHGITDPTTGEYLTNLRAPLDVPDPNIIDTLLAITDDASLLQFTSTSPLVEHAGFAAETRAVLRLLRSMCETDSR